MPKHQAGLGRQAEAGMQHRPGSAHPQASNPVRPAGRPGPTGIAARQHLPVLSSSTCGAPYFEVAVIHHTDCGSALLADEKLRRGFAERSGYDPLALAELPVLDPAETVRTDVERLLHAPQVSPRITVSGHVYDLITGLVTTVAQPTSPARR
jgi:hypothetical protein